MRQRRAVDFEASMASVLWLFLLLSAGIGVVGLALP